MHLEEAAGIANSMIDGKDISKFTHPRDRALSVTCEGQLPLEGIFLINDKPCSKYFNVRSNTECPLKGQLSLRSEATV